MIILPRVAGQGFIFVREPRIQPDGELGFTLNLPRGGVEPELSPAQNALKELEEETGVRAGLDQVRFLGLCSPDNGMFAIQGYCFEVLLTPEQWENRGASSEEHLQALLLTEPEFLSGLRNGQITDSIGSHVYLLSAANRSQATLNEQFLGQQFELANPIACDDHENLMLLREELSVLCSAVGLPFSTDGTTISLCGYFYADLSTKTALLERIQRIASNR